MRIQQYKPFYLKDYISGWDWFFITIVGLGVVSIPFYYFYIDQNFDWFSTILGLVPAIPAGLIWFMKKKENWLEKLPSYLNVSLLDPKREVARFELIPIQNGIDIRQQATSIFRELITGSHINHLGQYLRNEKEFKKEWICYDQDQALEEGKPFHLIKISLQLTEAAKIEESGQKGKAEVQTKSEEHLWYWCPLCHENNKLEQYTYNQAPSVISKLKDVS